MLRLLQSNTVSETFSSPFLEKAVWVHEAVFWAYFSESRTAWNTLYDQRWSREENHNTVVLREYPAHLSNEIFCNYRRFVCPHKFEVQCVVLQHKHLKQKKRKERSHNFKCQDVIWKVLI